MFKMKQDPVSIFIIDDDKLLSSVLSREIRHNFPEKEITIRTFETGELCEPYISGKPDVAIIDYNTGTHSRDAMNGIHVIDLFRKKSPDTDIILFTQDDSTGLAIEALTKGASDCVFKNEFMLQRLNVCLYKYFQFRVKRQQLDHKKEIGILITIMALALFAFAAVVGSLIYHPVL